MNNPTAQQASVTWFPTSESDRDKLARVSAQRDGLLAACKGLRDWCDANLNGAPLEYSKVIEACDVAIAAAEKQS